MDQSQKIKVQGAKEQVDLKLCIEGSKDEEAIREEEEVVDPLRVPDAY